MVACKRSRKAKMLSICNKWNLACNLTQNHHMSLGGIIEYMRIKVCKCMLSTSIKQIEF